MSQADLQAALAAHESEPVVYLAADVNITDLAQDVKVALQAQGITVGFQGLAPVGDASQDLPKRRQWRSKHGAELQGLGFSAR